MGFISDLIGGGSQETSTSTTLNPALASASQGLLGQSENFFGRGTEGIFQGSQLAAQDPLIAQGQNQLMARFAPGGDLFQGQQAQQSSFNNLLNAGNINDPLIQRQIADLSDVVGQNFNRVIMPGISQQATGAGQFGSTRQGVAQGIAAGDAAGAISRGATQALLGGQRLALGAQGLAGQNTQLQMLPQQLQTQIGQQRTGRSQQELFDEMQQFEGARNAELRQLQEFSSLLGSNPLLGESTQTQSGGGGSTAQGLLGLGSTAAGIFGTGGFNLFG